MLAICIEQALPIMDRVAIITPAVGEAFEAPYRLWRNHPSAGLDFPDIAPSTVDGAIMRRLVEALAARLPADTDILAGIDMGGFGLAGALACRTGLGFVDIRKVGSIRADVIRVVMENYDLGEGIAMSKGSRIAGRTVAVIDDCLVSGGTALSAVALVRRLGARCDAALFVYELEGMGGCERLERQGVSAHVLRTLPRAEAQSRTLTENI
jgi:adenine phosphoribosyltransferase